MDWFGSAETVDDKYKLFITLLLHPIHLFVALHKVHLPRTHLPPYACSLFRMKSSAFHRDKRKGNPIKWLQFRRLSKSDRELKNYNAQYDLGNS